MLKLRKILLYDYLYVIIFLLIIVISITRLLTPKKSNLNNKKTFTGIITKIEKTSKKTNIYIKDKETVIAYTYKDINLNLGDKVYVTGEFIKPSSNTTKNIFNYKKYLERKNIFYLIKINNIKILKKKKF